LHQFIVAITLSKLTLFLISFGAYILQQIRYHLCIVYFTFFVKWKTENQLKICLVRLSADENACIDRSFCDDFE